MLTLSFVYRTNRNRLHVRSVETILQIRYGLWAANATSSSFEPTEYMLKHFFDKPADNDEDSGAAEDCIVGLECYWLTKRSAWLCENLLPYNNKHVENRFHVILMRWTAVLIN